MNDDQRADVLRRRLPELLEIEELAILAGRFGSVVKEDEVQLGELLLPLYSFAFGPDDPTSPCVVFVGGVHGLERVGSNVAISYLKTVLELLQWDKSIQHLLSKARLVFYPLANPIGMYRKTRCNGRGVDLMRNAPLDADIPPNLLLVGGHRFSNKLPWYRGVADAEMEHEAKVLLSLVGRSTGQSRFSICLDLHSGFGMVDRLWFPYAYSRRPFEHADVMFALKSRLDRGLPNHFYLMEPQSRQYVTHGDLWDYLFLERRQVGATGTFLPLTLEMGSWLWIKKNPRQMFNALGIFNPMMPHRLQRTLRRHLALLDFLLRAAFSFENWADDSLLQAEHSAEHARRLWYP